MSACQAKISGQLVRVSGYRGQDLSPAKYLSFIVEELTEANGQTLATTLQSFRVINAEQTFPIEFASDINLQRDCPKWPSYRSSATTQKDFIGNRSCSDGARWFLTPIQP